MATSPSTVTPTRPTVDTLTVIALSALAYIIGVGLHELAGHGVACMALGGQLRELNAFYVDCNYTGMGDLAIRFVALAGPLVSLVVGLVGLFGARHLDPAAYYAKYLAWLLGMLGLMAATGYLLFSGITGLGDFGTSRDGVLYQVASEGLWRIVMTVLGGVGYAAVVYFGARAMDAIIGGAGVERVRRAQRLALTAYVTGTIVSVAIGLLNPQGIEIVLTSAAASSLGATSALMWMMQMLNRKKQSAAPLLMLRRSWLWIAIGGALTLLYAIVLGPSIRP